MRYPTKTQFNGILLFLVWVAIIAGYLYSVTHLETVVGHVLSAAQIGVGITAFIFGSLLLAVRLSLPDEKDKDDV